MQNYTRLIGSNNIIEIEQIQSALRNEGIEHRVDGKKALEVGNVELTGIEGATIMVSNNQLPDAKRILQNLGYTMDKNESIERNIKITYIIIAILFTMIIIYMIISAI